MTQTQHTPEIAVAGRWWALAALAFAMLTVGLDMTILNVALPTLATELDASTTAMQWFGASFTLVLGALIIPMGALGDRYGRRRLLLAGLVVFGVGSALGAVAGSTGTLIAARAIQGVGGAAMIPLSLAMLPVLFHDRDERLRAMNIWVTCSAVGLPLGPIVGGWILDRFDWGWIFFINVPMVVVGVLALAVFLPETRSATVHRLDLPGIALSSVGLVATTYGLIRVGEKGWSDPTAVISSLAGLAVLTLFVLWERRAEHPIVDVALFASRDFTIGTTLATIANFALFGLLFVMPQYFQDVGGADPLETGVRLLPMIGGMAVATRVGPAMVKRIGPRLAVIGGLVLSAASLGLASQTAVGTDYWFTALWITLLGAGIGLVLPASMSVAMEALTPERAGSGSGLLQAVRQVGGTVGIAVLGTILTASYQSRLDDGAVPAAVEDAVRPSIGAAVSVVERLDDAGLGHTVRTAFVHAMDSVFLVTAATTLLGVMLAAICLPRRSASKPVPTPAPTPTAGAAVDG